MHWSVDIEHSAREARVVNSVHPYVSCGSSRSLSEVIGVEVQPVRTHRESGKSSALGGWGLMAAGELAIRREQCADGVIWWLVGELDRATSALLEQELDAIPADARRRVVDLTGLVFIDSWGVSCLVEAQLRARGDGRPLSFRPDIRQRTSELTNGNQPRSRVVTRGAAKSNEDYYFALAMACAIVDHRPLM